MHSEPFEHGELTFSGGRERMGLSESVAELAAALWRPDFVLRWVCGRLLGAASVRSRAAVPVRDEDVARRCVGAFGWTPEEAETCVVARRARARRGSLTWSSRSIGHCFRSFLDIVRTLSARYQENRA